MRSYLLRPAIIGLFLAGCGPDGIGFDFPVSDQAARGAAPGLIPVDTFQEGMVIAPDPAPDLEARVAALRARAKSLGGPVLGPADRARLSSKATP